MNTPEGNLELPLFEAHDGYKIDYGIPVPTSRESRMEKRWETPKFPFSRMAVGASFVQRPFPEQSLIVCQNMVSGAASVYCKKFAPSKRFTTRQCGTFVRCWRIQ